MRRFVILVTVALALSIATPVAAQNATEPSEVVLELGDVRVTDVEWTDSHAKVTLSSTSGGSERVTLTDISPIESQGGYEIDQQSVTLRGEETVTVEIALAKPSNPQLSISSGGNAGLLMGESSSDMSPFVGVPATWALIRIGVAGAAAGGVVMIGVVGWSAVADRHDSEELVQP